MLYNLWNYLTYSNFVANIFYSLSFKLSSSYYSLCIYIYFYTIDAVPPFINGSFVFLLYYFGTTPNIYSEIMILLFHPYSLDKL